MLFRSPAPAAQPGPEAGSASDTDTDAGTDAEASDAVRKARPKKHGPARD